MGSKSQISSFGRCEISRNLSTSCGKKKSNSLVACRKKFVHRSYKKTPASFISMLNWSWEKSVNLAIIHVKLSQNFSIGCRKNPWFLPIVHKKMLQISSIGRRKIFLNSLIGCGGENCKTCWLVAGKYCKICQLLVAQKFYC